MIDAAVPQTILAIAGDPGGAAALAPVVKALMEGGGYRIIPCAYAQAVALWQSQGIAAQTENGLPGLIADADLLLTATSVNGENRELRALALARDEGIPTLALLDFWSNYRLRFTDAQGRLILPDRIAIMDDLALKEMVAEGFPPERLAVTGQPAFDRLAPARRAFTPQRRLALRNEAGAGEAGRLILFVSQPFADVHGSRDAAWTILGFDEGEVFGQCCRTLAELSRRHAIPLALAIRPHPREPADKFPEIQDGLFRAAIWKTPDQLEAVLSADLVLGMNSILLYEATLLGCPVVSIQPGLKITDPLPSNRSGTSIAVYDVTKLETTLEKALIDPDRRNGAGVSSDMVPPAGNATASVIEEIRQLIGAQRAQARKTHV